jgi:hypothetical protein
MVYYLSYPPHPARHPAAHTVDPAARPTRRRRSKDEPGARGRLYRVLVGLGRKRPDAVPTVGAAGTLAGRSTYPPPPLEGRVGRARPTASAVVSTVVKAVGRRPCCGRRSNTIVDIIIIIILIIIITICFYR